MNLRGFLRNLFQTHTVNSFHKLYYHSRQRTRNNTFWLGVPLIKCPLDLWIYQEIIYEVQPDIILETGTYLGGSALFFASVCDLVNKGKVISIDIKNRPKKPHHKRITYLFGSSVSEKIVHQVKQLTNKSDKVIVNLDSNHTKDHVLQELTIYSKFVSLDSYIIVEDTSIGGHPVKPNRYPGPMEAVKEFAKINRDFTIDKSKEKFYLTFNPCGYLKRIR